jgi:hypothetical protein
MQKPYAKQQPARLAKCDLFAVHAPATTFPG